MKSKTLLPLLTVAVILFFLIATPALGHSWQPPSKTHSSILQEPTPGPDIPLPEHGGRSHTISQSKEEILAPTSIIGATPSDMALAMGIPAGDLISASFYTSDPNAFGVGNAPLGFHFPIQGSTFSIISTGLAASADWPNAEEDLSTVLGGLNNSQGNDLAQLGVELRVPAGMNCANFDFQFFSEEFEEYIGSEYNDAFTAEYGGTDLSISNNQVVAPLNFAFDSLGNPISVNTVSGVIAPTATTYDGMTALRRAQTPVSPGGTALIVFSIQDLGDEIFDSAVFLDNFHWTNNLNCGGGVVPPPAPQGHLILQMPSALPMGGQIRPVVTVLNQSSGPANYIVDVQLRRGFSLLAQDSHQFSFSGSGSQQYRFNFGVYDPESYYIRAELFQGGERLETQVQAFSVGLDYLRLNDAADRLTDAAIQELNDGEHYAADTVTQAALTAVNETIDVLIDAFLGPIVSRLSGVAELNRAEVSEAVEDLTGKVQDFAFSIRLNSYPRIYSYHYGILDRNTYNDKRRSVENASDDLLSYARQRTFTWNPVWQADIVRREAEISGVNETYAATGVSVREDHQPPYVRWASLRDLVNQFYWFKDTLLPAVELIATVLLIIFIIVLVIIGIILLIPSGGTSSLLVLVAIVVGKVILATFTALLNWVIFSQTTKFLLSTVVIMLLAFNVSFSAEVRASPEVINRHQSAMQDLRNKVSSLTTNPSNSSFQLTGKTNKDKFDVSVAFTEPEHPSIAQVQLFRADGRLLDIVDLESVEGDQGLSTEWTMPPGKYWVVGTTLGQDDREVHSLYAQVDDQLITIDLELNDQIVSLGEPIAALVTLTNHDAAPAEDLQVVLQTLEGDLFHLWMVDLAPGEVATFQHEFVLQQAGGTVLRAAASSHEGSLVFADQPFIVGNGPAVGLTIDNAPSTVQAGEPITWTITAVNAGDEPASVPVMLQIYDENFQLLGTADENLMLSPGANSTFSLTPVQAAEPGKYRAFLYLGGQLYSTQDLIVEADGALFTILNADPIQSDILAPVSITINVQDELYHPIDAELNLSVLAPDGSTSNLLIQHDTTGTYSAIYTPVISGTYSIEALTHKDHYMGTSNQAYFSAGFPGLLFPSTQDQIILGQTQEITISVSNEFDIPVSGAMLIISGTQSMASGKTDMIGNARLFVTPVSNEQLTLQVKKAGYANTVTSLPVEVASDTTPPMLTFTAPSITNNPMLDISGRTEPNAALFVLGQAVQVSTSGGFTTTVTLHEGSNAITASASDPTLNTTHITKTVVLDSIPPGLNVSTPSHGFVSAQKVIFVSGTTTGASLVLANDRLLTLHPDGQFSGWIVMDKIGENMLNIVAFDQAGNFIGQEFDVIVLGQLFLPRLSR